MGYNGWSCHEAWELALALDNDRKAYQHLNAYEENYKKKIKKGSFNRQLAIKGLVGWIEANMPRLRKEGMLMYSRYSMEIKREVAEHELRGIIENIEYEKSKGK